MISSRCARERGWRNNEYEKIKEMATEEMEEIHREEIRKEEELLRNGRDKNARERRRAAWKV